MGVFRVPPALAVRVVSRDRLAELRLPGQANALSVAGRATSRFAPAFPGAALNPVLPRCARVCVCLDARGFAPAYQGPIRHFAPVLPDATAPSLRYMPQLKGGWGNS